MKADTADIHRRVWGYFECKECRRMGVFPAPSADTMMECPCGETLCPARKANQAEILRYGLKWIEPNTSKRGE